MESDQDQDQDLEEMLDTSWIRSRERIQNITTGYFREPMVSIEIKYIYINRNQYIEKIICESQSLMPGTSGQGSHISESMMLKLIQTKKLQTPTSKYKLTEIISYVIDLEPEEIAAYTTAAEEEENAASSSARFYKPQRIVGELTIPSSIFIFHDINTVYFVFTEVELEPQKQRLKPILKLVCDNNIREQDKKQTKRVKICENPNTVKSRARHSKTRKHTRNT
jgi:hypothetical protein